MKVCWNLSSACNKNCNYCFRELFENFRSLEDNKMIINNLKDAGLTRITFSGGEPTFFKDLIPLMKYAKELDIENYLITNGSLLNKDNLDLFLPYLDKITFSVDSPSEYVNYESGRGYDSYNHIKDILPSIKLKYPDLDIEINSVITKENISEVDYLFKAIQNELYQFGIKKWKIIRFYPLRGYALERKELFNLSDDEFKMIEDRYGTNYTSLFKIETRDIKTIDDDLIVSPCGSLKKASNGVEDVLIDDLTNTTKFEILNVISEYELKNNIKKLKLGRN